MGAFAEIKGRLKEAAGALSGSKDMKRSGKADRLAEKTKDAINTVSEKATAAVDSVNDRSKHST